MPKEIKLRERAPLEFSLRFRGGLTARLDLPSGNVYRTKARSEHRGNRFGQSLKEMFLIVKGDPIISTRWLAQQIDDLASRVGDVRRQRIGARFDSNKLPALAPLENEEEQELEQEQEEREQEEPEEKKRENNNRKLTQVHLPPANATTAADTFRSRQTVRNKLKQQRRGQARQETPFKCSVHMIVARTCLTSKRKAAPRRKQNTDLLTIRNSTTSASETPTHLLWARQRLLQQFQLLV